MLPKRAFAKISYLLPCRDAYNAKLAAGEHAAVAEVAAAYEASQGLDPVDYVALYNKHKDAIVAATEAKVSGSIDCVSHANCIELINPYSIVVHFTFDMR